LTETQTSGNFVKYEGTMGTRCMALGRGRREAPDAHGRRPSNGVLPQRTFGDPQNLENLKCCRVY